MPRSLLPREHGAYVQLAAPLVAACAAFGATLASALLAVGACLAFLANEPLLVMLGHRGKRARAEDGARARRHLLVLAPLATVAGLAGLALAPSSLTVAGAVAIPAGVLVLLAWRRKERTLVGELVAAVALTGAAAPVAVAAGASSRDALWGWGAWAIGFAFTVVAVHRVIERNRKPATVVDVIAFVVTLAAAGVLVYVRAYLPLPLAVCSLVLLVVAPPARYLRPIGFALVGASLVATVLFVHTLPA